MYVIAPPPPQKMMLFYHRKEVEFHQEKYIYFAKTVTCTFIIAQASVSQTAVCAGT